jgi:hypothetical protein
VLRVLHCRIVLEGLFFLHTRIQPTNPDLQNDCMGARTQPHRACTNLSATPLSSHELRPNCYYYPNSEDTLEATCTISSIWGAFVSKVQALCPLILAARICTNSPTVSSIGGCAKYKRTPILCRKSSIVRFGHDIVNKTNALRNPQA